MSTLTRPDAVHVDIIGDKNGAPRVQTLGTASILGILPDGHVWTIKRANGEAECCGTFHVDVEGQTTHIRCVTTGHTILSSRGLVKTLQMMADMGNAPVIVSHDPGASSTIKNAEYTPSGEFAPVAEVAPVDVFAEAMAEAEADEDPEGTAVEAAMGQIKTTGRVFVAEAHNFGGRAPFDTLVATGWATLVNDGDMSRWVRTRYTADRKRITDGLAVWDYNLNVGRVVLSTIDGEGWFNVDTADGRSLMDGVRVTTVHPHTRQTASDALAEDAAPLDIPAPDEAESLQAEHDAAMSAWSAPLVSILTGTPDTSAPFAAKWGDGVASGKVWTAGGRLVEPLPSEAEVWAGTGTVVTYPLSRPVRTALNRRKHKRTKVNARRVRGGF